MGLSRCNSQIFSFENRKVKSVSGTMGDKGIGEDELECHNLGENIQRQ